MIGGEYYFQPPVAVNHGLGDLLEKELGKITFFASGRDALFSLLRDLPQRHVIAPDLLCLSVHHACVAAAKSTAHYPVTRELFAAGRLKVPGPIDSCLLAMHYFGLPDERLLLEAQQAGLVVISDVTHLLFNPVGLARVAEHSDYLFASLRKSGPFPDGGFVSSRLHQVPAASAGIRENFFALRTAGLMSRSVSAQAAFEDDENFHLLKQAEAALDNSIPGDFACSYLSRKLLYTIDVEASREQIHANMRTLKLSLPGALVSPCQPGLPSPYFACIFEDEANRDRVRNALAVERCHCPIHWKSSGLPVKSPISRLIFSIPCDARYDEADMRRVCGIIESCLKTRK